MFPSELFRGTLFEEDIGLDFSGVVVKLGPPVASSDLTSASRPQLKVGDRVLGIARRCFASHVIVDQKLTFLIPDHLTFEEAATIPIAYATALICLYHFGRISAGQTALIHAAAGGLSSIALFAPFPSFRFLSLHLSFL